jgi:glycine/serine hydroxymethyltransferase
MTNKYSEGYPGARYYGGNEYVELWIDTVKILSLVMVVSFQFQKFVMD